MSVSPRTRKPSTAFRISRRSSAAAERSARCGKTRGGSSSRSCAPDASRRTAATRRAAAFLLREGLSVGAYTSPHVAGWSERIQVDGEDADIEQALERVREPAERLGATQFEVLTAAALAEFAAAEVGVAVVEAGLGGGPAPT